MFEKQKEYVAARRLRRRGKDLLKEGWSLAKRARKRGNSQVLHQFEAELNLLHGSLKEGDVAQVTRMAEKTSRTMELHFAAYRVPSWRENLESIGYAVAIALAMRALVVEAFKIPSGSMIPTLFIGDQIFVNKYIYGPRIPFTTLRPIHLKSPARGEVVVFICPVPPYEDYIKRIVAVAGDTVAVRHGQVRINGSLIPRAPIGTVSHWDRDASGVHWRQFPSQAFKETNSSHHYTALEDDSPLHRAPDFGPETVPEGHVFVMGDNRDHSYDSRAWGPVPVDNILGRAQIIWWSWGQHGLDVHRIGTWVR